MMASAFSHAVVALAVGKAVTGIEMPARFWWLSIACSILPDADVLGFAFGVRYGDLLGHRGLTHSLAFALVLSVVVVQVWFSETLRGSRRWWFLTAHFFLVTASHGFLDAMTDGGLGIAFFAPFDETRYFLPWRPVMVSPIGIVEFFTPYGARVLLNEMIWIWVPAALLVVAAIASRQTALRPPRLPL
ncbi:MAG: metal-dependent hydrolase [Nitrospiraceae bacterium]|nr:metal-dependent hydrolase [Nitrospiraceae bacterium]